ncbi:MAG: C-type lectin domain-containing protein, partial [Candidatus Thorarchaeota archaeon]
MTLNNTVRLSLRRPRNSRILFTIIPIVLLIVSCFILPILPDAKTPPILSNPDFEVDTILAESVPSEPIWTYVYDGFPDSDNNFQSVIQSRSGDLIAVGNQMSTGSEDSDWFTVLTDSQGGGTDNGQVWTDYYGGSDSDSAFSLVQAINNDDIIMTGYTTNSDTDFSLRRLHPDGTENWTVTFNEAYDQVAFDIAACSNGDLVVVGSTIEGPLWPSDMQLFRIFPNGTEAWNRTYGGSRWEAAKSVIECSNGDLVLVGYSTDIAGTGKDLWVLRIDGTNGDVIWDQIIGGDFDDYGDEVIECADGGFAIVGSTKSFGHSEGDMWLIRLDSIGDVVWEQGYGGTEPDWGRSLVEIPAGGFALIGSTESYGSGNSDVWLVRTDNFGNVLWSQTYGGEGADTGNAIVIEQVGGLIIAGGSKSWGGNDEDAFLLKIADPPMWLQVPSDVTIEYGELYSVQFEVTATYIDSWWLNDTEYFNIDGNGLLLNQEVLPLGYHDVQVWVNDTLGNAITATFTVTVSYSPASDTLAPLWERTYGGSSDHTSQEIVSCESGGFAIAGTRGLDYDSSSTTNIVWHHDCSNTTGFDQYPSFPFPQYPIYPVDEEGDIHSDGTRFYFDNFGSGDEYHGPLFAHEFDDTFTLAEFKDLTVHLEGDNAVPSYMGLMCVYLADTNFGTVLEARLVDNNGGTTSGYFGTYYYHENVFPAPIGEQQTVTDLPWKYMDGVFNFCFDEEAGMNSAVLNSTNTILEEKTITPLANIELDHEIKYLVVRPFRYTDVNVLPMYIHDISVTYSKEVLNPSPTSPTTEDAWLARLDSFGNLMWNRTYGNGANNTITSLIECDNGDFLMAGSSWNATTKSDFWLLRVDSEGNPLWNKTYGGNGNDEVASVIETSDGGFAATGYKYNLTRLGEDGTPGSYDMWLIKTDSTGLMLWNSTEYYELGSVVWNYDQKANCVIECSDGDLLVAGTVCYYDAFEVGVHNLNGFLYRTSADGVFELADQYGLNYGEQFNSVEECANGDFIVIGSSNRYDPADVLVCRLESSLSVEFPWWEIYQADGENWGVSIRETNDGFVMLSNTWAGSLGNQDTRLMRINSEGAYFWQHEYGGSQLDEGSSIIPLAEGGYAVTGFSKNNSLGISNAWFFIVQPVQWTDISQNQVIEFGEAFNYRLGCESVFEIVAPHGGELFNGNEYRLITSRKYWAYARDACSSQGGHLVSITSPEENNFIWSLLPAGSTWIGLTDNIFEGSWYWVGTSDPTIYFNWEPGEPNAFTSGEDYCVVHESTGKWNDANNEYYLPYVCEWETQHIKFDWELNDLTNFSIAVDTSTAMADITNITQLQVGEYSFNIFVNDSYGDFLNKTITLTVEPHKAPEWIATPTNQLVEFGEDFEYDLEATDTAGIDTWVVNNTIDFMIDGNGMITSITALPVGEHPVEVIVTDILGNSTIAEFIIAVVDTTAPEFIVTPEDQHLQYEEYFLYSIGATDLSGIDSWWLNDTTYVNVTDGILFQLHTIPCGVRSLKIF